MKSKNYLLLALLFCITVSAQIKFESGYFINNNGEKINCLIKNLDWKNNPSDFLYKLSENDNEQEATIKNVQEFGIIDGLKYIRFSGKMDNSDETEMQLNYERNPDFKEVTLFLRVLIEGNANLYSYTNGYLYRYFFKTKDKEIEQLVHKRYLKSQSEMAYNNFYKQQIVSNLKCAALSLYDIERLEYEKDKLVSCFLKFNSCDGAIVENFDAKGKVKTFHLSLRPGVSLSSFQTVYNLGFLSADLGTKMTFRFGLELEAVLPFNKNKWAVIFEPTYQYYKSENQNSFIDYKTIDFHLGIRHYMFLSNNSKLFLNIAFVRSYNLNTVIKLPNMSGLEYESTGVLSFGIGYKIKNKFSLEYRNVSNQNLLNSEVVLITKYTTSSLVLGYTLF